MNKYIYNIFITLFAAVMSLGLVSCSDDDGNDASNDNFIVINGQKSKIVGDCLCDFVKGHHIMDGEIYIPAHGGFSIDFSFDDSFYRFEFSIDGLSSPDIAKINKNYVSDDEVSVDDFRRISSIELSTSYGDEDGNLFISEKGSDYVVVNFDNFSFIKDTGNREIEYTINGKVKFFDTNR